MTLSVAQGRERERERDRTCAILGETLRMCLAVMKEWNVVRLESESIAVFFSFPGYRFLVFHEKDFVEEYCLC